LLSDSKKSNATGVDAWRAPMRPPEHAEQTLVAKAAHLLAAAGETAKTPLLSAYIRSFELAED
jgi:hypothetical protein